MTIVTVLRSGSSDNFINLGILARMVSKNLRDYDRMACLTDIPGLNDPNIDFLTLKHLDWPGEWSTIELFRDIFQPQERVLFLEPSVVILGNLRDIVGAKGDFISSKGVMLWTHGDMFDVYRDLARNPISNQKNFNPSTWLRQKAQIPVSWDEAVPGQVVDYGACASGHPPIKARLVSFEGWPLPWTLTDSWIVSARQA